MAEFIDIKLQRTAVTLAEEIKRYSCREEAKYHAVGVEEGDF